MSVLLVVCFSLLGWVLIRRIETQLLQEIRHSLEMDTQEKRARMQRMRRVVKEYNIYRWAGNLLAELAEIRLDLPETSKARPGTPEPALNLVKGASR